jgi:hypothetical protein
MPSILVMYDLKDSAFDYSDFHNALQNYEQLRLSDASLLLATYQTASELFDQLAPFLAPQDWLAVFALTASWKDSGRPDLRVWLQQHL